MFTSDLLKNGSTLQGKAGLLAINANDLLQLNAIGQLFPVVTSDYAAVGNIGGAIVASTVVATTYQNSITGNNAYVNPADNSAFIGTSNLASSFGFAVFKYTALGALVKSVTLDATGSIPCNISIAMLSNGNLAVVWGMNNHTLQFAVIDTNLNIVVAKTSISGSAGFDNSNNTFSDMIALTGGGFAVAYAMAANVYLAIYTNAGGVTFAGAAIPSTPPTDGSTVCAAPRIGQLSNGNIAIAITSTTTAQALGHAIRTVVGVAVLAYTVLDAATLGTSATVIFPEISVLTGVYCTAIGDGTNAKAYVLNNAGAIQGSAYSAAYAYSTGFKLVNDGINFWAIYTSGGAGTIIIAFLPVTGTGYVTNTLPVAANLSTGIYDRGLLVSNAGVFSLTSAGAAAYVSAGVAGSILRAVGDFAVLTFSAPSNTTFAITKYMNAAIVGVSQSTLAAGNAGTLITYSQGPGGYPCNAVAGSVGKGFNHAATNIVGNTGTILGNSAAFAGIV